MMTVVYDALKALPDDTTPCVAAEGIDVFVAPFGGFAQKQNPAEIASDRGR